MSRSGSQRIGRKLRQDIRETSRANPSSPSPPSSSPGTPAKLAPPPRNVIAASDDEDEGLDDSDDSLADLSTILGTRRPPAAGPVKQSVSTARSDAQLTPRAKRTALTLPTSPLTLNPKVHKFDIKALEKAALLDDAINASSARAKAAAEKMAKQESTITRHTRKSVDESSSDMDDEERALVGVVTGNAGGDAHKVLRAVRRAEHSGAHLRYCFFDTKYSIPKSSAPPKVTGPWKILTKGTMLEREQNISSGLPQTLLDATGEVPAELFDWMLDEVCVQESSIFRTQYCNLIAQCPTQIQSRITPERLERLFLRSGAAHDLQVKDSALMLAQHNDDPYSGRSWACLADLLALLGSIGGDMNLVTAIYTAQTLLRLSIDPVIIEAPGLLVEYQDAIFMVLSRVYSSWDTFCYETTLMLHTLVRASSIRMNILLCLPLHDTRTHDLRRRLAISFLFDDPSLAQRPPTQSTTMRDLINRLHSSDFTIHSRTDFLDLQSNILLLDAAVDDGSFSATTNEGGSSWTSLPAEQAFNDEVDELSDRLRAIWRKINDSGLKLARTEAKGVLEWVQQRLAYLVRTRKKLRKSVFDLDAGKGRSGATRTAQEDDPFLSRQQDYMKNFLLKQKEPKKGEV